MALPEEEHIFHVDNWRRQRVRAVDDEEGGTEDDAGVSSTAVLFLFVSERKREEITNIIHSDHFRFMEN